MFSKLLSKKDNNKINQWLTNKDKPLFITGYSDVNIIWLNNY